MQILNCENSISSCCTNFGLAKILSGFNGIIQLIHIIVPILLIIMAMVNLFELMSNPEEKKLVKKLFNKVIAAVVVFFIPTFMSVVLNLLPNSFDINACMKAAKEINKVSKNNEIIYMAINEEKKKKVIFDTENYESGVANPGNDNRSDGNGGEDSNIRGDGSILLIAGHSYPPYCSTAGLADCRGPSSSSGYAEEDETRKLVKLIKANLDSMNVKSDIANALLAGDTNKMNKSFYIESSTNSKLFNKFNWDKYKFVLEVHFNATSQSNAKGTLLCKKSSSYRTKADDAIVNAVISHTGNKRLMDSIQGLNNVSYFSQRNIPIVYLETEFYDNKSAMRKYTAHINEIAHDIAVAIKNNYG